MVAVAAFCATRLAGLDRYPVSFLGDEAVQMVDAANLWHAGMRDPDGMLFPAHFPNGPYLNPGTSVYLQLVPYAIAGFSVVAARALVVVVAASAAVILALTLRDVYRVRAWWSVALLLSVTPAWFLHTRTALETGVGASLWCWFFCLYLRFRAGGSAGYLYGAVVFGALAFYAYSPIELVVPVTAALFLVFDIGFVKAHGRTFVYAAGLVALLAVPELRFQLAHGGESTNHLHTLGSYWTDSNLDLGAKAWRFVRTYAAAIDPRYWYLPNQPRDLSRHVMKGYGNILAVTAPFTLLGLGIAVRKIADARYRLLLLATLAAPVGAATVDVLITRVLALVIPAALLAALGLAALLGRLRPRAYATAAVLVAAILLAANLAMLRDALDNGGPWYGNYGLDGLQYGGHQVTSAIADELRAQPGETVVLSPTWANATDTLVQFFLPREQRVLLGSVDLVLNEYRGDLSSTVFVLPPEEYVRARASPALEEIHVVRVLSRPDGRPGFYFVRLAYSPGAARLIAHEQEVRRRPVTELLDLDGTLTTVTHSPFDIGRLRDLFDGDTLSLARTAEVYPMTIRLSFARPRALRLVRVRGADDGRELRVDVGKRRFSDRVPDGEHVFEVELAAKPTPVRGLTIRFRDNPDELVPHVHAYEIELR